MHTIDDLNLRLLSELKEIAEQMGVKNAKRLTKQDLVTKILEIQVSGASIAPEPEEKRTEPQSKRTTVTNVEMERKMRPRRRENVAPTPEPANEKELSSEELTLLLSGIDLSKTHRRPWLNRASKNRPDEANRV